MDKLKLNGAPGKDKRRELDFYPTPKEVTIALMDFLKLDPCLIWEPACGDGAMVKILESYGHNVIGTDISTGHDFMYTNRECDAIITNPPFNISQEFIEKSLCEADIVCMLLKSQYWHAKKRISLFEQSPPAWVLPLTWRPDFLEHERSAGEKGSPTMEVAWTVWIKGDTVTKYKPLHKPNKLNS